ncbi:MAG: hypothetical protein C4530_13495 [Desulfobacteraceae bacterium]|nr:MAG: hypothetical protein C4530_13495 [Desulfobacteraceae bacterium]
MEKETVKVKLRQVLKRSGLHRILLLARHESFSIRILRVSVIPDRGRFCNFAGPRCRAALLGASAAILGENQMVWIPPDGRILKLSIHAFEPCGLSG